MTDFANLQRELLIAVRSTRTQGQISQRLGYKFNVVYRWESGRAKVPWTEFVKFCKACKINLGAALINSINYHQSEKRTDLLVKRLVGESDFEKTAKLFGISRFTLSDWLSGKREPSLEQILSLLNTLHMVSTFIGSLVDIDQIPSISKLKSSQSKALKQFVNNPYLFLTQLSLGLSEYKNMKVHENGYVARVVGVPLAQEKQLLKELEAIGVIAFRDKKFHLLQADPMIPTGHDWRAHKAGVEFWSKKGIEILEHLDAPNPDYAFNQIVMSISSQAREQIREATKEYFYRIRTIAMTDKTDAEKLLVLSINCFNPSYNPGTN